MAEYNLPLPTAISRLKDLLARMQAEEDREQLKGMSPDDAFERGYALCIRDLESLTGPDPKVEYNDAVSRVAEMEKKN